MEAVKIGLIADVQYCDCENGFNFERTKERFYRNSLNQLDNALRYFSSNCCRNILQLGDLIDGKCSSMNSTEAAMDLMKTRFQTSEFETFHVVGNHELYNLSREEFCDSFMGDSRKKYQQSHTDLNYYRVDLSSKVSLIVLDSYDISILNRRGSTENDLAYLKAKELLSENNKNENLNNPIGATHPKFVAFNGAISTTQLEWIEDQLKQCSRDERTVIVSGHIPVISSHLDCITWNSEDVLNLIHQYPCVKAYIAGHQHSGEIIESKDCIHITIPGIIECLPNNCSFGILTITDTRIQLSPLAGYWEAIDFAFKDI